VKLLGRKGQLDRTWLVVTSDHGYHLGQFTLPVDKRLPYETDVRVPLLVIAPGNQTLNKNNNNNNKDKTEIDSLAVVSIDLAPTILDMASLPVPSDMDGLSLLPLILSRHPPAEVK
jgi:arylsulfatase A-like enzyme